jgi:hypothetical protein
MYVIKHCFIYRPSDSNVSEDTRIEPRTVATLALAARRFSNLAQSPEHKICVLEVHMLYSRYKFINLDNYGCGVTTCLGVG